MRLPGAGGGAPCGPGWLLLASLCSFAGAQGTRLAGGQTVCRGGTHRPCYKIAYFHDATRRLNFQGALQACKRDGGELVSIESPSEQGLIEKMIQSYSASDGDFWIGLTREEDPENSTECPYLYTWSDGSLSTFRNWYADEPSCGRERCVVVYHQPSAPAGDGGRYMFQWNDDRCILKNNFICKYSQEKPTVASEMAVSPTGYTASQEAPVQEPTTNKTLREAKDPAWSIIYLLISSIPALLLIVTIAVFSFWVHAKRKQQHREGDVKEKETWVSSKRENNPSLEIYNVIKRQSETDLTGTRPEIQNSSFHVRHGGGNPEGISADYGNMVVKFSESGFVTMASNESGFVTNDIYELCNNRVGRSEESTWVENEIYGY